MAIPSSVLAWRTPWTEEAGGLRSTGSHRVGHEWVSLQTPQERLPAVGFPMSRIDVPHPVFSLMCSVPCQPTELF